MVVLPVGTFEIVVDLFALVRIATDKLRRQRQCLPKGHGRAAPKRDVFTATAVLSLDDNRVLR